MHKVFIGVGSNLGDRVQNCNRAVRLISKFSKINNASSLYETEPIGLEDQPNFVNGVLEISAKLSPLDLLRELKIVEKTVGRKETVRWGPRVIDLDILFYDNLILNDEKLIIPHPRVHERWFVLFPFSDLYPHFEHPAMKLTVDNLLSRLNSPKNIRKIGSFSYKI